MGTLEAGERHARDTNKSRTALRALKVLGATRGPVSLAEIAGGIGADRSIAYRMLMTLMGAGYVVRDEKTRTTSF